MGGAEDTGSRQQWKEGLAPVLPCASSCHRQPRGLLFLCLASAFHSLRWKHPQVHKPLGWWGGGRKYRELPEPAFSPLTPALGRGPPRGGDWVSTDPHRCLCRRGQLGHLSLSRGVRTCPGPCRPPQSRVLCDRQLGSLSLHTSRSWGQPNPPLPGSAEESDSSSPRFSFVRPVSGHSPGWRRKKPSIPFPPPRNVFRLGLSRRATQGGLTGRGTGRNRGLGALIGEGGRRRQGVS